MAKKRPKLAGQGQALFFDEPSPGEVLPPSESSPSLFQKIEALKTLVAHFKKLSKPDDFANKRCRNIKPALGDETVD